MFEAIGEGHRIMHEGPKKEIDLDELERLAKAATPGPWKNSGFGMKSNVVFTDDDVVCTTKAYKLQDAAYIVAACNTVPELIVENRELREKVRKLEIHKRTLACRLSKAVLHPVQEERSTEEWIKRAEEAAKEAGE